MTVLEPEQRYHLEPQTGVGFILEKGQRLRIIDPIGGAGLRFSRLCAGRHAGMAVVGPLD